MFRQTVLLHPPTRHTCDPIGNREEATEGLQKPPPTPPIHSINTSNRLVPQSPSRNTMAYDGKEYAWKGENRLVPAAEDGKLVFAYDFREFGERCGARSIPVFHDAARWAKSPEIASPPDST